MTDNRTVFVVDDDDAAAASVAALMSASGHRAVVFRSAEEFLDSYDGSQPGCLVLDMRLRGMSGIELYQTLVDRGLDIPTIFISGYTEVGETESLLKTGAIACLEKPYASQELCDLVQAALAKQ